jgi:hypothetical protein
MKKYFSPSIKTLIQIFMTAALSALPFSLTAESNITLSFDNDLAFTKGEEIRNPIKQKNIKLVPGINGKAVYIPHDGYLEYSSEGLINPEEGSISLWIKLNNTPCGIFAFRDRDRLLNGDWGAVGNSPFNRHIFYAGNKFKSRLNSYIDFLAIGDFLWNMIVKQIFANEWNNLVYTWKKNDGIAIYLNGILLRSSQRNYVKPKKGNFILGKTLCIGSGGKYQGIDGVIDEFKIYSKVLSDNEIRHEYAKYHNLRIELLDYVLHSGQANNVRIRIKNISEHAINKTININGQNLELSLKPGERKEFSITITPEIAGLFRIVCNAGINQTITFETYALDQLKKEKHAAAKLKLIQEINCTEQPNKDEYTDAGTTRVVQDYRESTALEPGIGFAYRMKISNPGKPHWLEVEYPNNATRRFMVFVYPDNYKRINTGASLDSIGIITGGDYKLSDKNRVKRLLFWPDSNEIAVATVAYKPLANHSGPAIAKIRLYENDGALPVSDVPATGRGLARWNEDPTMPAGLLFNNKNNFKEADLQYWYIKWTRAIEYMKYMGYNQWVIQVMDYFGDMTAMNATLSCPSPHISDCGYVPGWADLVAAMLKMENLSFYVRLNQRVFRNSAFLSSLKHNNSENMKFVRDDGHSLNGNNDPANILNPATQDFFIKLVKAYRDKFSKYENFKGICFNEAQDFSFHSLRNGYDNFTCSIFEKETEIKVSGKTSTERYDWLMKNAKKEWIEWRCKKVLEFAATLGRTIQENGNKHLNLQLWLSSRFLFSNRLQDFNYEETLKEAGIDMVELNKLPGIEVVPMFRVAESRTARNDKDCSYFSLSGIASKEINHAGITAINIIRDNFELWPGMERKNKHKFRKFWRPAGGNLADNICKGYATPLPNTEFALDIMTGCLADYDAQDLLHGFWGNVENGEHEAFRKFYKSFRNIPRGRYDLAPGTNDPVTVRIGASGYYIVNREGYPITVQFKLDGKDFIKNLYGNEVFSETVGHRPQIRDVKIIAPDKEINYLKAQIQKTKIVRNIYKKSGRSTTDIDHVIKSIDEAMMRKKYTTVRHLMYTQAARAALNEMSISIHPEYNWHDQTLSVTLTNIDPKPFSGALTIKSFPETWTVKQQTLKTGNVESGESKTLKFNFQGERKLADRDSFLISVNGNKISKEYQYNFACRFASERDFERPNMSAAWLTSQWHLTGRDTNTLRQRIGKKIIARYMLQWDRQGSGLRVIAEIDDNDFIPPTQRGQMYNGDSIQIYFDQKNNAQSNTIGYDYDDVVFQVGMLDGKPEVWRETEPKGTVDVPVKIVHKKGKTYYDLFIPKCFLPQAELTPGNTIGFSILFNMRLKDQNGEFSAALAPLGESPYLHPGKWQDFYLSAKRPNAKAAINLYSYAGDLTNVKTENCELTADKIPDVLKVTSMELNDTPQTFSVSFVPEKTGIIILKLSATWMSRVKYISVSAQGADLSNSEFSKNPDGKLENWIVFDTYKGNMDIPYGRQRIEVKEGIPVTITAKAVLPDEVK